MPTDNENTRREKILKKFPNHAVILGDENDIFVPIVEYNPEILIFGYDQKVPEDIILKRFPGIMTKRAGSFEPENYKSSILRKNS